MVRRRRRGGPQERELARDAGEGIRALVRSVEEALRDAASGLRLGSEVPLAELGGLEQAHRVVEAAEHEGAARAEHRRVAADRRGAGERARRGDPERGLRVAAGQQPLADRDEGAQRSRIRLRPAVHGVPEADVGEAVLTVGEPERAMDRLALRRVSAREYCTPVGFGQEPEPASGEPHGALHRLGDHDAGVGRRRGEEDVRAVGHGERGGEQETPHTGFGLRRRSRRQRPHVRQDRQAPALGGGQAVADRLEMLRRDPRKRRQATGDLRRHGRGGGALDQGECAQSLGGTHDPILSDG